MPLGKGQVTLGRSPVRQRFYISPALFFSITGLLLIANALSVTGFFMSSDIAALFDDHSEEVTQSYEMRIADLKTEVDRLNSRQYARTGNLNLQMQELVQQQELLAEQHQYVSALARMAEDLGIEPGTFTADAAPVPAPPPAADLASIETNITTMMRQSESAIDTISTAAQNATDEIINGLKRIGVAPADGDDNMAMGGPFEGLPDEASSSAMLERANSVVREFERLRLARMAAADAPVHAPLAGTMRISSRFGARTDPFSGKRGYHSGIDFPAKTGSPVRATGAGTVSFAGQASGYGNMIEISHVNGVVSRYGHLSKILVEQGQAVDAGDIIGKVGSTGRSTGPHLHFEIRRADSPVNPQIFLNEGKALSRFL